MATGAPLSVNAIADLPAATTPLSGSETSVVVQGGALVQTPVSNIPGIPSTPAQIGAASRMQQVAQRCGVNGQYIASGSVLTLSRSRHLCPNGADAIQLVYPNFYMSNSGGGELKLVPTFYIPTAVTYSGGSSYAVGDIDTFFGSTSQTMTNAPTRVLIIAVAAGAPTAVKIIDPGLSNVMFAAGSSPNGTSGSGTGATATFTYAEEAGWGGHIGIEPTWGQQVTTGTNSIEAVSNGIAQDMQLIRSLYTTSNGFLVSDIIPVNVPIGGAIGIRFYGGINPTSVPYGRVPMSATNSPSAPAANFETGSGNTTYFDNSVSGTVNALVVNNMLQPIAILGIPKRQSPIIACVAGDSRSQGVSSGTGVLAGNVDVLDADGNISWFEKALSQSNATAAGTNTFLPWSNFSVGSDKLASFVTTSNPSFAVSRWGRYEAIKLIQPTAVLQEMNANDLNQSVAIATVLAQEQRIIAELKGMGVKYVFTCTTDPWTTSSDNWATVQGQTFATGNANMVLRNAMLRAGTWAPYDFFIDFSPVVESSVGSGLWAANGVANAITGDGVHGSPLIITRKAALATPVIASNVTL